MVQKVASMGIFGKKSEKLKCPYPNCGKEFQFGGRDDENGIEVRVLEHREKNTETWQLELWAKCPNCKGRFDPALGRQ